MRAIITIVLILVVAFASQAQRLVIRGEKIALRGTRISLTNIPVYDTILYAASFGVSSNNMDNSGALNAAHSAIQALPRSMKKLLLFPDGAALHFLNRSINLPYTANLTIDYRRHTGTVLYNDIAVPSTIFTNGQKPNQSYGSFQLIRQATVPVFLYSPVLSNIDSGSYQVQIAPDSAAKLAPGDMVSIKTNKFTELSERSSLSHNYQIVAAANATTGWVTFTTPFYQDGGTLLVATDSLHLQARKPNANWVIKNLNIQCYQGGLGSGIKLDYFYNSVIENSRIDGAALMQGHRRGYAQSVTDAFVGFEVKGHNVTIRNIRAENFWDFHTNLGYGLVAGGVNVVIENSYFFRAKHGITISDAGIVAWIIARNNVHNDAMFDTHPEGRYVITEFSDFYGICRSANAMGAWCRGLNQTIRNCRFYGADTTWASSAGSSGISIPSYAGSWNATITDNEFYNLRYAIGDNDDTFPNRNLVIQRNKSFYTNTSDSAFNKNEYAVYLRDVDGATISDNNWQARGQGLYLFRARNLTIQRDTISYGNGLYGGGIYLAKDTNYVASNINIYDSRITYVNGGNSATNPIRIDRKHNFVNVQNNTILGWGSSSSAIGYSDNVGVWGCMIIQNNSGSNASVNNCGD